MLEIVWLCWRGQGDGPFHGGVCDSARRVLHASYRFAPSLKISHHLIPCCTSLVDQFISNWWWFGFGLKKFGLKKVQPLWTDNGRDLANWISFYHVYVKNFILSCCVCEGFYFMLCMWRISFHHVVYVEDFILSCCTCEGFHFIMCIWRISFYHVYVKDFILSCCVCEVHLVMLCMWCISFDHVCATDFIGFDHVVYVKEFMCSCVCEGFHLVMLCMWRISFGHVYVKDFIWSCCVCEVFHLVMLCLWKISIWSCCVLEEFIWSCCVCEDSFHRVVISSSASERNHLRNSCFSARLFYDKYFFNVWAF